jgi:hypothetical protein
MTIHHDMQSALDAVRKNIATNARREADERASADAELLLEREALPVAPPRGREARRGTNRREFDARRHNFKSQVLNRIIDEAAVPSHLALLEAAECAMRGDRERFATAMSHALDARCVEVLEWYRGCLVADLLTPRNEEE